MTRTPADLTPRPGDCLILCRDAGDPDTLSARLKRVLKALGRRYGVEVVWVRDVLPGEAPDVGKGEAQVECDRLRDVLRRIQEMAADDLRLCRDGSLEQIEADARAALGENGA